VFLTFSMKKFKFKLASVLDIRKKKEQDALVSLAAAQKAYQDALERKQNLIRANGTAFDRRQVLSNQGGPALGFQLEQNFIEGNKKRILQSEQAISRCARGVEKALRVYLFARKQTKMIEVLEENERKNFTQEQKRKEQKQLEELVTMRARFSQNEEVTE
jgi:flagellar FliJ protein